MKSLTQTEIAKSVGITQGHLSNILSKRKTTSWKTAKKLAKTTNTDPILWLEGSSQDIKAALKQRVQA